MLIVNADDFGASASVTDAICRAFAGGAITSTSGMVWMGDSDRAAERATELDLPIGLHLNLTTPFTAPDVPPAARERQLSLTELLAEEGWRERDGQRLDRELLRGAILDQLECFCEQFGQPTHIDGHHHIHVRQPMLEVLPRAWPVRAPQRVPAQIDVPLSRDEQSLRASFRAPDLALAIERIHPDLGGVGLGLLDRSRDIDVEVMTHPGWQHDLDALLGAEWLDVIARLRLGCYADLGSLRP